MKAELKRKKLYNEAFALIKEIQGMLLDARAHHEADADMNRKAA